MIQNRVYLLWLKSGMLIECSVRLATMIRGTYTTIVAAGLELMILSQPVESND
jgi:hypothetical protein